MRTTILFLLSLFCFLNSFACECISPDYIGEIENSKFIFLGEIDENTPKDSIQFKILGSWKGIEEGNSSITIKNKFSSCYKRIFEENKKYIIFLNQKVKPVDCSNTGTLEDNLYLKVFLNQSFNKEIEADAERDSYYYIFEGLTNLNENNIFIGQNFPKKGFIFPKFQLLTKASIPPNNKEEFYPLRFYRIPSTYYSDNCNVDNVYIVYKCHACFLSEESIKNRNKVKKLIQKSCNEAI